MKLGTSLASCSVLAFVLSAGAFAGAQIGARASRLAKEFLLQRLFGLALIAVAVELIIDWFTSR